MASTIPPPDPDRIEDAVLALLWLTSFSEGHGGFACRRAWKGHDWEALGRLHQKGLISDPVGKSKSIVFTEEGAGRAGEGKWEGAEHLQRVQYIRIDEWRSHRGPQPHQPDCPYPPRQCMAVLAAALRAHASECAAMCEELLEYKRIGPVPSLQSRCRVWRG